MCNRRELFTDFRALSNKQPIFSASGHVIFGVGIGTIFLECFVSGRSTKAKLTDVLFVPDVKQNLISVGKSRDASN